MDNREENSRNTEQDRVDNPVENTVSTMVETALSENKRERKKREKAEKKKNGQRRWAYFLRIQLHDNASLRFLSIIPKIRMPNAIRW